MNPFLEFVPFSPEAEAKAERLLAPSPFADTEVSEESEPRRSEDEAPDHVAEADTTGPAPDPFADETSAAQDALPVPGAGAIIHGRYVVDEKLGSGGSGSIYRVRHQMLGQTFALKTLDGRIGQDPEIVARFVEEAKATSRIGHENIVFVTDFGVCPTYGYYLVMEHLDGETLEALLQREGRVDLDGALHFAHEIGGALAAVHDLGIVHRDLKPANVMVARLGNRKVWKVVDFGLSSAVGPAELSGTPSYMPPEQALGHAVDGRADQFSLAVIVYEMLTGSPPWKTRSWLDALAEQRARYSAPDLSARRPDVPKAFSEVIGRALSLSAADRFSSIEDFLAALERTLDHQHRPTLDPFDQPEATRNLESLSEGETDVTAVDFEREKSVQIEISDFDVSVTFCSLARFKREYRRNVVAGGLFIPTNTPLPPHTPTRVTLSVDGEESSVIFAATVVTVEDGGEGSARGFGVGLDDCAVEAIRNLLRRLELGFENVPDARIRLKRKLGDGSARLNAAEAFFLSRIDERMTIGRARATLAALPFDFDSTLRSLAESGHIVIGDEDRACDTLAPGRRVETRVFSASELTTVIDRADYFMNQNNYLAARELLEEATRYSPDSPSLLYRLARLRLRFDGDLDGAKEAITRAVRMEPNNPDYQSFEKLVAVMGRRSR